MVHRWEYDIHSVIADEPNAAIVASLDVLGLEGWEVCGILPPDPLSEPETRAAILLRRPRA